MGSRTARLQELIHRRDKVLAVLHPPTAAHARIMQRAGCEALFVGTGGVVGAYTGLADVGTASLGECLEIAGWISQATEGPTHAGCGGARRLRVLSGHEYGKHSRYVRHVLRKTRRIFNRWCKGRHKSEL